MHASLLCITMLHERFHGTAMVHSNLYDITPKYCNLYGTVLVKDRRVQSL